eukprot:TRINITY_DN1718_c0_g1_i1.p1 TRINITY_DN1718_c0_g1~~TRINITY_DN1718_c0_g1_i1.p1  ORF type:complete len:437 (+),score=143.23 TRINITY_DN1718_c0_g1_i1:38-1348(+)
MSKIPSSSTKKQRIHNPLDYDISSNNIIKQKKKKMMNKKKNNKNDEDYVPRKISEKILLQAKEQQDEEEGQKLSLPRPSFKDEDSEFEEFSDEDIMEEYYDVSEMEFDVNEDEAFRFFKKEEEVSERRTLGDIIMEKIREHEEKLAQQQAQTGSESLNVIASTSSLSPKVIEAYTKVGVLLHRWHSGKFPKAFKIIPSLSNWEEIMYLTKPHEWSRQTFYQATRLFASNLNTYMAQRFYNTILLPKILDEIADWKKLNWHIYRALKKSVFKPAAFFKGIILPVCEMGCTLKEATIIGSVIAKVSIPVLPASACLVKLTELDYSGPSSLFIRILINKKYALPYLVVDSLVKYFSRFADEENLLPVLWHQSLLVFVQRYKNELTEKQKKVIKDLCKVQKHPLITPEVQRELKESTSNRGEVGEVSSSIIESIKMVDES